jgi:signal transduction histidine kinase
MFIAYIVIALFLLLNLYLTTKIILMRRSADEIRRGISMRIQTDTNTLLSISSHDCKMKQLAADINQELRLLRRERRRLQGGNQELLDAVTNLSHDLRTPLTAICGYLDLLEQEEKSIDAARYLTFIDGRVQALTQLTEELFRYSLTQSNVASLSLEPMPINGILEESLASFYATLTANGITPHITITETPIIRFLNKAALMRVFGNILNNALKYSDGDLTVTLDDTGELTFSNTANRLTKIQVGKLFDRFFSVEEAADSTGLGLAISTALVEQMQGTITASLEAGRLIIHITFPKHENSSF